MRNNFKALSGCFTSPYPFLFLLSQSIQLLIAGTVTDNRVINGTDVNPPHKYPWMVSLFFTCFPSGAGCLNNHLCGGAVLNEYYILTAAHCCYPVLSAPNVSIENLFVLTGLHERNELQPWSQNLSIAECIVHELYSRSEEEDNHHDIALIRVKDRIVFSDKVTPVNLPSADFDVEIDGEFKATLIGWGLTNASSVGSRATVLQEVELPVITSATCQLRMGFTNFFGSNYSLPVTESMFCIGFVNGEGKGGCSYDSGSPVLMLNQATKTYVQIGIVSWTVPPCASTYTVNVRVSAYLSWIKHHAFKCVARTWDAKESR